MRRGGYLVINAIIVSHLGAKMADSYHPDKHTPAGVHGNSTHGIVASETRLRKGQAFDGLLRDLYLAALDRRGLSDAELDGLGARGDYTRNVCRLSAVVETIWAGLQGAGAVGDVAAFYGLVRDHGHRFDQLARHLKQEIDILEAHGDVLDLQAAYEAAQDEIDG